MDPAKLTIKRPSLLRKTSKIANWRFAGFPQTALSRKAVCIGQRTIGLETFQVFAAFSFALVQREYAPPAGDSKLETDTGKRP